MKRFLLFHVVVCRQVYLCLPLDNNIVKVDLDGQDRTVMLSNLGQPIGIAIEYLHSRVCWTSRGKYSIQFNMIYSNNIQQTIQFKTIQTCYTRNVV